MIQGFHGFAMFSLSLSILADFCSETPRKLYKRCWTENVHIVANIWRILLWHQVKYVLTQRFCQDTLENWFSRQRCFWPRKDNPSMANAIWNQISFKSIVNGNVADSGMIALTDEPLPCWKPKKRMKVYI